ncbi:MAG: hypothetical protein JW384_01572 [Nitrosomonadaceae bacterium]|nr:hypothetical protein [Nitrosomonadaceae bacterium]
MKNEYWDSEDKDERTLDKWANLESFDKKQLIKKLRSSGAASDIATEIAEQILLASNDIKNDLSSNVIFIFADNNEMVVTGIHVPSDALNGEDGPVLMRGAGDKSIIAAFSRDFIASRLRLTELLEEESAGLPDEFEQTWMAELENLAEMVRIEIARNPPESWEQLLEGER